MRISNPGNSEIGDGFILIDALMAFFLLSVALLLIFTGIRTALTHAERQNNALESIIETHNSSHIPLNENGTADDDAP